GKQTSDSHTNIFFQVLIDQFLERYDIDKQIEGIRDTYRKKCGAMVRAIEKYFPDEVEYTVPDGGMFLWCTFPEHVDIPQLVSLAAEKYKVVCITGAAFLPDTEETPHSVRLNFSSPSEEEIDEGIKRLAGAINELI
ncbi:MAG: aminotransferase class I/II-fold pyridoxal phosphate-dependent enzyme, partial [Firmicutes bacterium]|nr:aminotransferase class I/II-fold pyridoxal phosphate-dependent enzyme [Bacillota bacterium]